MGIECRGLLSEIYLRKFLPSTGDFPSATEAQPLYEIVKDRWLKHWFGMAKAKEAYTRTQFLDPLLKELGWHFVPEADLPSGSSGLRKRPDYCLCRDEATASAVAEASSPTDAFRHASTVLEAKKVHTALDEVSKSETPGWFPSQQIQDYLQHAKDASGTRFFDWAILTNGHEWRLYSDRAATDACFSIELARDEEFCSLGDFRLFIALFRPTAFERRPDGRCPLDDIREESLKRQAALELDLRQRIFGILEDLANGYRDHTTNAITEADWPALYDTCLIFLYRLLFILYAESRSLLPVRPNGHRSNKHYREHFSLAGRLEFLRDRANHFTSAHDPDLYEQLLRLFRLIDGVNPKLNEECNVARDNGGLFSSAAHPRIDQWRVADLTEEWWERIKDSRRVAQNRVALRKYQAALKPGDVTLVGLIAEGGQGMRTANNARFLGYLEGTPQAEELLHRRQAWATAWLAHAKIGPVFRGALLVAGGDPIKPIANSAAWESTVESLRQQFGDSALGFGKTDLYRIVPAALVANSDDFQFAWTQRKAALLARWQKAPEFKEFWSGTLADEEISAAALAKLRTGKPEDVSNAQFCRLCSTLNNWINASPSDERTARREAQGLRSSELYDDPDDCARIATIYNGLGGKGQFVPFRKGDPDGNRWIDNTPLFIEWSRGSVEWLSTSEKARWQGHSMFFTPGLTYNLHGRGVPLKSKLQEDCVFDASASRLSPITKVVPADYVLCLFNSAVVTEYVKRFANNTWYEINDLRQVPVIVPTAAQAKSLRELAERAMEAKRCEFGNQAPSQTLAAFCRTAKDALVAGAPAYLRPDAQEQLLVTPKSCLAVIELTVNWEAERLYGVEGLGPFDEF